MRISMVVSKIGNIMNFFLRIIRYVRLHITRDPKFFFTYLLQYCNPFYQSSISFTNTDSIVSFLEQGKSLIRLGDGEIYILNEGGLSFQSFDPKLKQHLQKCISEYTPNSPYVLGLNRVPLLMSNLALRRHGLLSCWLPSKVYYQLYFNKNVTYFDAAVFYDKDALAKYIESYCKKKKIIILSNQSNLDRFKANNTIPFSVTAFIETPENDTFSEYDLIKDHVLTLAEQYGMNEVLIFVACGPAGKVLAYELALSGIQAVDIGNGIEVAYSDKNHILNEAIRMLQ